MDYYFSRNVQGEFAEVKNRITALLKDQGFGVKTEIDVTETFKEKLGIDFKRYHILGACNPGFAFEAIQAEDKVGVLLPCNVILIEQEAGLIEVAAMDARAMMSGMGNPALEAIATRVNEHISRAIDAI
jgi:uncharacterized protein (DUF302 family)